MLKSLGLIQIFVLIVVAALLVMTWDFGRRILENVTLVQASQAADAKLTHAEKINVQLLELKQDVTTDAWVIKKARVDLHYAQENETLFIPAATPPPLAVSVPVIEVPPAVRPFWQDLLETIFGPSQ